MAHLMRLNNDGEVFNFYSRSLKSSSKALDKLRLVSIRDLKGDKGIARGQFMMVRIIQEVSCTSTEEWMTLIEDSDGTESRLNFVNYSMEQSKDVLPVGIIIILKEPRFKMTYKKKLIECDCPTDMIIMRKSHPLFYLTESVSWKSEFPDINGGQHDAKTAEQWKNLGNQLFNQKKYTSSMDAYLLGIKACDGQDQPEWKLLQMNVAESYLQLELYGKACEVCEEVLQHFPNERKALFRAGKAYYKLRDYKKSLLFFNKLKRVYPEDQEGIKELSRVESRLVEEETGSYDMYRFYLERSLRPRQEIDCADYKGPVEVREIEGKGRGIVVTQDVQPGTLLIVSKALAVSFNQSQTIITGFQKTIDNRFQMDMSQLEVVAKVAVLISKNPKTFGPKIYDLCTGDVEFEEKAETFCNQPDETEPIADVERIKAICRTNCFCLQFQKIDSFMGNDIVSSDSFGTGLFLLPSYINHSCVPNVTHVFYNDVCFIRAFQPLKVGDEIGFSYAPIVDTSLEERQMYIQRRGFSCQCLLCQLDEQEPLVIRTLRRKIVKEASFAILFGGIEILTNKAEKTYRMSGRSQIKWDLFNVYYGCYQCSSAGDAIRLGWLLKAMESIGWEPEEPFDKLSKSRPTSNSTGVLPNAMPSFDALLCLYRVVCDCMSRERLTLGQINAGIWAQVLLHFQMILTGEDVRVIKKRFPNIAHLY